MATTTKRLQQFLLPLGTLALGVSLMAKPVPQDNQTAPDNTRQNKDQSVTADHQGKTPSDRDITRGIRKSVYADKSLSTYGHNVKVVTQNGKVTLRGPVRSDDERKSIHAKAAQAVGEENVTDRMDVAPPKEK
jgi:hyperosmotically inducible periplasmic protein